MYNFHNYDVVFFVNVVNFVTFGFWDFGIFIYTIYTRTVVLSWCRGVVVSWYLMSAGAPARRRRSPGADWRAP